MKKIIDKDEVPAQKLRIIKAIKEGAVFIYPTDTMYSLGCDATNAEAVKRVREIKEREKQPFSVIAPSKEWIYENFDVKANANEWLEKLPGHITLIMDARKKALSDEVNPKTKTIGIRMPDHWSTELLQESKVPIITTCVNRAGRNIMTSLEDMSLKVKAKVDFIIYDGEKKGNFSTLVHLTDGKVEVVER